MADPLLTSAAVCARLGVERNALERTGGNLIVAKEMAGHSSIATTINAYATQAEDARQKAATAMDEALRREVK